MQPFHAPRPEAESAFPLGVIEGYFGRQWSWRCRRDYAAFLQAQGLNSYVYAPKNDPYLRKAWHTPYPDALLGELLALREHYARQQNIAFGVGLSPFELYRDFSAAKRRQLADKLAQLESLGLDVLCILFDDMLGALDTLAASQLRIVDFILERSSARHHVLGPTYYSYDPLLTQHFGAQPERYLDELGQGLDPAIAVFWTGPKVISNDYPAAHLKEVGERLRRKPLLWDNYPVNDAKRLTPFLHLQPFQGRDPAVLGHHCSGHLSNPMNQGYLSQLPLYALARHYRSGENPSLAQAAQALCPPPLAALLIRDAALFQQQGREALDEATRMQLLAQYDQAALGPMAEEVVAWLRGDYVFDPACLT